MKNSRPRKQRGFTLIEVMVAMAVLSFGVLSLVSIFTQGLRASYQTQIQYIAQQKAQEAMETIFTARDTRLVTSAQINNVSNGGIFKDNAQPLYAPGPDGLFGTADDDSTNPDSIVVAPGPDGIFGTADDVSINLNPWMTRTILIAPVANTPNLKSITVTVNWTFEGQTFQYQISSLISNFS
ncbi:MAG: prepilin-type N-terminal cleavage/methylation domain-containing protein [Candidatus Acidiferrum sp.]|jgi:type IV pilus modification protein PilV